MIKYLWTPKGGHLRRFFGVVLILIPTALWSCEARINDRLADRSADQAAIRELLMKQQEDWNEGDVHAFMTGYLMSDSLRFASGGAYRFGWQATLERYLRDYPDREAMGHLTFSELDIDVLSADWALAFGAWDLDRGGAYENIGGLFTLVLVRTQGDWKITYDHTSTRP